MLLWWMSLRQIKSLRPLTSPFERDMKWCIGSPHAFNGGEPGFDPTPKPRRAFYRKLSFPFFQTTDLKTIRLCGVLFKQKKIQIVFPFLTGIVVPAAEFESECSNDRQGDL
jgi:hypothetical protein